MHDKYGIPLLDWVQAKAYGTHSIDAYNVGYIFRYVTDLNKLNRSQSLKILIYGYLTNNKNEYNTNQC